MILTEVFGGVLKAATHENKLLGLEVVRFASAFSVLVWHYQHLFFVGGKQVDFFKESQPFYSFISAFYNYGYYGVHVFWCISGFIFFWKYSAAISEGVFEFRKFFVYRFSRLYPLHLVTLLIVVVLQAIYFYSSGGFFVYQKNDVFHFVLNLFLASNWGMEQGLSFNGPIWSVSLEVLVYFIFFFVARYFGVSVFVNFLFLFVCFIAKAVGFSNPFFECLAFFYLGGGAAIFLGIARKKWFFKISKTFSLFFLFVSFVVAFVYFGKKRHVDLLILMAVIPVLIFFLADYLSFTGFARRFVEIAGNLTYASYLVHFPIQMIVVLVFNFSGFGIPLGEEWFFLFYVFSVFFVSYFVYRFFEIPSLNFIRIRFK